MEEGDYLLNHDPRPSDNLHIPRMSHSPSLRIPPALGCVEGEKNILDTKINQKAENTQGLYKLEGSKSFTHYLSDTNTFNVCSKRRICSYRLGSE